jgi:hypothetical protein
LGPDLYLIFGVLGLAELLAYLASYPIKLNYPRMKSMSFSILLTAVTSFMVVFFPIPDECLSEPSKNYCLNLEINLFLATIGKFGISLFTSILIT